MAFMGALPARFRRERVLVVGCGDVGMRALKGLQHCKVLALTSSKDRVDALRQAGAVPFLGNLDHAQTIERLAGMAHRVLHLAPPPSEGTKDWHVDPRTQALTRVLARRGRLSCLVYGSTTGVYGDCQGQWVDETRAPSAATPRAMRRVDAESRLRAFGRMFGLPVTVLRIPGIYAMDRPAGSPRDRLLRGLPVLKREEDVYTNHIHADDLARVCVRALWRARRRVYNVSDDTDLPMGDFFDLVADHFSMPRPERVSREEAPHRVSLMTLSFMSESRRLRNDRMKRELGVSLRYPTVKDGLAV